MSRRKKRFFISAVALLLLLYCAGGVAGGVLLAELQLRPPRRAILHRDQTAQIVRDFYQGQLQDVSVTAADGMVLRGWYVIPRQNNGSAVILAHGVSDNREGIAGFARLFLDRGYRVLLPDARAHGTSGGDLATYGLRESDDIHRWADWLYADKAHCIYGFGESMGSALLLQSLARESRFCAMIVESPFSRFEDVAYERASAYIGMPSWFGKTIERPVVDFALWYTRRKYGLDFRQANPADAVAKTKVPLLLIGDKNDINILPHHVLDLHRVNPRAEVWMVEGAVHGGAWGTDPDEFNRRVTSFFASHTSAP